jgi:methylglutaconyl-CoA hydratase
MGDFNFLELQLEEPGVAWVWLDRPETLNALFPGFFQELQLCFRRLSEAGMRVVVLAGRGTHFCSGSDIRWLRQAQTLGVEDRQRDAEVCKSLLKTIESLPCPLLGRVQGGAYGLGLALLACCDQIIAEDRATFAFSEVRLGLAPAIGMSRVVKRIGLGAARELMLGGGAFDAPHALRIGMVNYCVAPRDLDKVVENAIDEYLECAPEAVAATKHLLLADRQDNQAELEEHLAARILGGAEAQEGLDAFAADRIPSWDPRHKAR